MDKQQRNEVIKALAYGKTPEAIAAAEGVELGEVRSITYREIKDARADLEKGGFVNVD